MKRLFANLLLAISAVAMLSCEKGTIIPPPGDKPADYELWYTSIDGSVVSMFSQSLGADVLYNTYSYGMGLIVCRGTITQVGRSAFRGCERLESVLLPDKVTFIGDYAFSSCRDLTTITFPASVTEVGEYAIAGCGNLESLYFKSVTPPAFGEDALFASGNEKFKIYVPAESVEAYKSAANITDFADKIEGYDYF